jgi:hypothetical protein
VDPVVSFVAAYAAVMLAVATGLHRLGRVNTSPWRGRVLAGHRRSVGAVSAQHRGGPDWPHSEVPRLYTSIGTVAAAAATVLPAGVLLAHHRPAEVLLLGLAAGLAAWRLARLVATLRAG